MTLYDDSILLKLRNEAGEQNLNEKLKKLEKSHQSELRMLETAHKRLRNKFEKRSLAHFPKNSEASKARMYETYNPGFFYRRNGESRVEIQSSKKSESLALKMMREMLFTNGEVDIEKLTCLHLLAAHQLHMEKDICTVFPPDFTRLIDSKVPSPNSRRRRKRGSTRTSLPSSKCYKPESVNLEKIEHHLPRYVLNIHYTCGQVADEDSDVMYDSDSEVHCPSEVPLSPYISPHSVKKFLSTNSTYSGIIFVEGDSLYGDDDMEVERTSLYVNCEIERLVGSVIDVLKPTNPNKIQEILNFVGNPVYIKRMLQKPKIQKYLEFLRGKQMISGSKCFRLTAAKLLKIDLLNEKQEDIKCIAVNISGSEREMTAVTLDLPANKSSSLEKVLSEIRANIMKDVILSNGENNSNNSSSNSTNSKKNTVKKIYRRPGLDVNNSGIALAGSIAGTANSKFSLGESIQTEDGFEYGESASSLTLDRRRNTSSDKLSSRLGKRSIGRDRSEDSGSIDTSIYARRKMMANESAESSKELNANKVQTAKPKKNSSLGLRKTDANLTPPILDRVAWNRIFRNRMNERKAINEIYENLTHEYSFEEMPSKLQMKRSANTSFQVIRRPEQQKPAFKHARQEEHDGVVKSLLKKLTNSQRILVGMHAASVKSHKVNVEGIEPTVRSPLTEIVAPCLSEGSIIDLTSTSHEKVRTTMLTASLHKRKTGSDLFFNKSDATVNDLNEYRESLLADSDPKERVQEINITESGLQQIRREIANKETDKKVQMFLQKSFLQPGNMRRNLYKEYPRKFNVK